MLPIHLEGQDFRRDFLFHIPSPSFKFFSLQKDKFNHGQGANSVFPCKEGFYCFVGAATSGPTADPTPFNSSVTLTIDHISAKKGATVAECPVGYFCPLGSPLPRRCPAGYYCDIPRMAIQDRFVNFHIFRRVF